MGTKCSSKDEMTLMRGARASLWKILRGVSLKGGTVQSIQINFSVCTLYSILKQKDNKNMDFDHAIYLQNTWAHFLIFINSKLPLLFKL